MKKLLAFVLAAFCYAGVAFASPVLFEVQITTGPTVGVSVVGAVTYNGQSQLKKGLTNQFGQVGLLYDVGPSTASITGHYTMTGRKILNGVIYQGQTRGQFQVDPSSITVIPVQLPIFPR